MIEKLLSKLSNLVDGKIRFSSGITHIFEGLLIFGVITIPLSVSYGCLAVIVWFWSREKVEHELRVKIEGEKTSSVWSKGWFPWEWGRFKEPDSLWDLLIPVVFFGLVWVICINF